MSDTINRGYPKPVSTNLVSEDVLKLMQAFDMIDADVEALLLALNGKSPVGHTHSISDVAGLTAALSSKSDVGHTHAFDDITGVSGTAAAPAGYVLYKTAVGWVPGAPAAVLGAHTHQISDIINLQSVLDTKLDDAALAEAALKPVPVDADTILILDSAVSNGRKRLSWSSLKSALKTYFDTLYAVAGRGIVTGTIIDYAGPSVPAGYLAASGQAVSRTAAETATLFALFGTTYGSGNGTTTFNLPNPPPTSPMIKIIKT
jgi:hypothetical protein